MDLEALMLGNRRREGVEEVRKGRQGARSKLITCVCQLY